ncbi:hypothetical protein ma367 [Moumouvirus australiensis]|uniref:Uncharacterized protein n=1 Tax=Moumouvirus australiensis TaxID=2109587 RepID=A0A2P1ELI4_9VIRU|nr:hypothetical protein QKC55_gp538 [Moumouvirus australiensis]AVL94753.1 hypothetical protein ma367 [Moumouvirus australiensis]
MLGVKNANKKNVSDENTNYLYEYFINEDKFNELLKDDYEEENERMNKNKQNIFNKPKSERNPRSLSKKITSESSEPTELPSSSGRSDVEFDDEDSENMSSVENSIKSPYKSKIEAVPGFNPMFNKIQAQNFGQNFGNNNNQNYEQNIPNNVSAPQMPLLGDQLVGDIDKYIETPEEKRARGREVYSKLQDLVDKYNVKLTREFTIDDDPDIMEAEYDMHKERRNKTNQVKMYKQILLTIISGTEFLNEKYNPFEVKLKDWSKQIATDMDDYTEVLEEIYEKYRDRGGKMPPEFRLLFMIILSGVTFHLSQSLFGPGGLKDAISNNPNVINKLLGGLMKGGGLGGMLGGGGESAETKEFPDNNKKILESIKKYNNNNNNTTTEIKSETNIGTTTDKSDAISKMAANQALNAEREKRLLAEQKAAFEAQLRKQQEMYTTQLEQMRNQQINSLENTKNQLSLTQPKNNNNYNYSPKFNNNNNSSPNQVLSDVNQAPRYMSNPLFQQQPTNSYQRIISSEQNNMFASEIKKNSEKSPKKFNNKNNDLDEIIDSLETSEMDIDEIIVSSKKSTKPKKNNSLSKPINSTRKPNNSVTRSVSKRRSDGSDTLSTSKKNNNVIKL